MNIFKLEEKIEISKELGLEKLVDFFQSVKKSTSLKFQKIEEDEIYKKIKKRAYKSKNYKNILYKSVIYFLMFVGIASLPTLGLFYRILENGYGNQFFFPLILSIVNILFGSILSFVATCNLASPFLDIESESISRWIDDIPYGALLAMKEAKDSGLKDFEVYYPVRLKKEDPILTAKDKIGNIYELFHWDDEKIYNS